MAVRAIQCDIKKMKLFTEGWNFLLLFTENIHDELYISEWMLIIYYITASISNFRNKFKVYIVAVNRYFTLNQELIFKIPLKMYLCSV